MNGSGCDRQGEGHVFGKVGGEVGDVSLSLSRGRLSPLSSTRSPSFFLFLSRYLSLYLPPTLFVSPPVFSLTIGIGW